MSTNPPDSLRPLEPQPLPPEFIESIVHEVRQVIGTDTKAYDVHGLVVVIDAHILGTDIVTNDPERARYLPLLPDLLENPIEVWQNLWRDRKTGNYELRIQIIKAYATDDEKFGMILTAQAGIGSVFTATSLLVTPDLDYFNQQRMGKLWYAAQEARDE